MTSRRLRSRARTINDAGAIVGTATYTPTGTTDPIAAGSHGVLLMPMQFRTDALSTSGTLQVDSDSTFESYQTQPATALKVAKWNDAFTHTDSTTYTTPLLSTNFIDTDVDTVYVRTSDGAHKGAGTITGKLQGGKGDRYI